MARVNLVVTSLLVALCAIAGSYFRRSASSVRQSPVSESGASARNDATGKLRDRGFLWSSIQPAAELKYHPCDGYECARLEVPMDWNDTAKNGDKVAIAIMKLPAKVPITDPRYGGVVLFNPGGPGGSGIDFFFKGAQALQTIIDGVRDEDRDKSSPPAKSARFFDVIGFDPRGVNNTTPFQTCFPNAADRLAWELQSDVVLGTPEGSLEAMMARQKAVSANCLYDEETNRNGSKLGPFIGTPYVVRDMVEIIERHGQWREKRAKELKAKSDAMKRLRWKKGEEPLQYWGISYGTILGATFSAMQPHRVRRVMLDAVADAPDYYEGGWTTNLQDTDEMMSKFFEYCHKAGREKCPLEGDTPEELRTRWHALEDRLQVEGPIPVPGSGEHGPSVITLSNLKNLVWSTSYTPFVKWDRLASIVGQLLVDNNGTAFAEHLRKARKIPDFTEPCAKHIEKNDPDCATAHYDWKGAAQAILCSDGSTDELATMTPVGHWEYWEFLKSQSHFLGDAWATIRLWCVGWKGRAAWKFERAISSDVTAHPILFVGNTLDNVTPVRNARKARDRFKRAGLLEVRIEGHGLLSNPSLCAGKAVRQFFQTGELPADGKVCLPQKRPILGEDGPDIEALPKDMSKSEKVLQQALEDALAIYPW